jgi:hypothetical protein
MQSKRKTMHALLSRWTRRTASRLSELGPYLAIELIMPGGSLLALGLWWYRHRHAKVGA